MLFFVCFIWLINIFVFSFIIPMGFSILLIFSMNKIIDFTLDHFFSFFMLFQFLYLTQL